MLRSLSGIRRRPGPRIYDEVTFRDLLAVERERSRRTGRPFVLLLIDSEAAVGACAPWTSQLSRSVFSSLSRCLRETDFIGWYLDQRIAGAVLTELDDRSRADVAELVARRVRDVLRAAVQSSVPGRLGVRCVFNPELSPGGLACSS
jgi:hypothetical protein